MNDEPIAINLDIVVPAVISAAILCGALLSLLLVVL